MIDTVFGLMLEDTEMDIDGEGNNEKMSIFFTLTGCSFGVNLRTSRLISAP